MLSLQIEDCLALALRLTPIRSVAPKTLTGGNMKTASLLKAAVLGGGVALLANPAWAGGGAHSYDGNQAGRQGMHDSGKQVSNIGKEQKKDIEQALQDKGFEPGSVDGVIDAQTQSAISQFQRDNNLPATGTVDEQTAKQLGVEIAPSSSEAQPLDRSERQNSFGSEGSPSSSSRVQ
jgi:peptidoglycan hydrolase-like protein with peptidoglycan-binding domain